MYRVDLYIDGQRGDLFQEESIEINLSVQNIKDISKVFGDFTNSFTIPASPTNNAIFKHYYNVDIYGGFNANVRVDSFIEVNNNLFRTGVLELESVQIKDSQPYAYQVGFYSNVTSLKDTFGEDKLNDLDLSAQDHTYNDTNIVTGLNGYVSGTDSSIIYPLISPVPNWYYNSSGSQPAPNNIAYHSQSDLHGVFYYDLKPAIKLQKIIDAIETKYGITFQSDFFDSADFGKLFMWCHRRAGYMFKDQPIGQSATTVEFDTTVLDNTAGQWNLNTNTYTLSNDINPTLGYNEIALGGTTSTAAKVQLFRDGVLISSIDVGTTVSAIFTINSAGKYTIRIASASDAAGTVTITSAFLTVKTIRRSGQSFVTQTILQATNSASQIISQNLIVADQMPEQKISDFIGSLVRAFNLVIVPVANNKYDIEPLDDWYAEGTTRDVTEYIDTEEITIRKPSLYRRINFKYNETEAILGEQYRLQNDIGYGDLRADFTFDGEEFEVEVGFDHMLYERLDNLNNGLTTINVGKSITRELEPYIGSPLIFYVAGQIRGTSAFAYIAMDDAKSSKTDFHLVSNVNNTTAESVTKTLNFGTEVDPYLLQGFSQGLYSTYWKDYITDLYDTSRRTFMYSGQLPLGLMLALKINDKLTIGERNYIINQMKLNLSTGETQMELLNDV
jgi:hypothetical protein